MNTSDLPVAAAGPVEVADRSAQFRGSRLALALLHLAGWELDFDGLPGRQGVIAVYPHTSNWDFIVGVLAKWAMGIPVKIWGKDSLFRIPVFGPWLRYLGGIPVDRAAPRGIVGDMVRQMEEARAAGDHLWLVLAPEGTRSLRPGWKSGFYQVALGADLPLGLAYLDYGRKRVGFQGFIRLSGDVDADMREIARRLGSATGYRAHLASPIRLS